MNRNTVIGGLVALALVMVGIAALTGGGDDGDGDGVLALGETAVLEYAPVDDAGKVLPGTTLAITVTAVRPGTEEELTKAGFELDSESEGSTPHYIDARFENRGGAPVERNLDVSLEGPDGESLPRTLIFDLGGKGFKPCPEVTKGTLKPGDSYESCTLVLVPEGDEAETVLFVSQKPNAEIVFTRWDASAP